MAFWIPAIAVGVGLYLLYESVSESERRSYKEWKEKRVQVEKTIEEHERNIRNHIHEAERSYDFHKLVDLHYSSMKVADVAYKMKKDADSSLESISKMIKGINELRGKLQVELKENELKKNKKEIYRVVNELKAINEERGKLFLEQDKIKSERESFYKKLKGLNLQTRNLKLFIRDRCGERGKTWYQARLASKK